MHSPANTFGNAFPNVTWSDYVDALELAAEESYVAVLGITDYMAIDGYVRLSEEWTDNDRLKDVELLIPNIEFRTMPPTDDGKAINLHLLVDPSDPTHIDRILRSLGNLRVPYKNETYGCSRDELTEFGRAQNPKLKGEAAYNFGLAQFKPGHETIIAWLAKEAWLKKNSLVGVANGKDGISGLPLDGFSAIRDELLTIADFVFSGNPSDRKHYLGLKPGIGREEILRQYRSLKPCVHGCDAHVIEALMKPDLDRSCWIKGDPTFDGLRQILWEPADRVHIGKVPPQASDKSQLISKISVANQNGWFKEATEVDLNSGLVAVIGEKGMGKTALVDLIAFAAGMRPAADSHSSFIEKGSAHLEGMEVKLHWGAGETTTGTLTDHPYGSTRPRVRYLSQDFVERLCSDDHGAAELQAAIEEVVFAKLDELQREGYSSFNELRQAREASSNGRRETLRGELAAQHKEIERLESRLAEKDSKRKAQEEAQNQVAELKKQLPDATEFADQQVLESLSVNQARQKELEQAIAVASRQKRAVEAALGRYLELRRFVETAVADLQKDLPNLDSTILEDLDLQPTWNESAENLLRQSASMLDDRMRDLREGTTETSKEGSLAAVQEELNQLREKLAADDVTRQRILDLQKQIAERGATSERLDAEITLLETKVTKDIAVKKERRLTQYVEIFELMKSEEATLRELYSPLQKAIEQLDDEMRFSVTVGYQVDMRSWHERSLRFFDNRRSGTDSKRNAIEAVINKSLLPAWKSGQPSEVRAAFSDFVSVVAPEHFVQNYGTPSLSMVELYDWMFSVDHISLSYTIKYAGLELEFLSPGTRGIALLVLYLLMDEDDTRPLLIDQPEGNLDNSSVFSQLVPYIRKAKSRRQIILVTHNPNLVVATDAEQVIVATAERPAGQSFPRITYVGGSLEHSEVHPAFGTREAVCQLLEGGTEAFRVRENRYSLPVE